MRKRNIANFAMIEGKKLSTCMLSDYLTCWPKFEFKALNFRSQCSEEMVIKLHLTTSLQEISQNNAMK